TLSITAVNEKGEESEEVVLKVKLNSPPKILSSSLIAGEILFGQKEINWASTDLNNDKLIFSIAASNDGGITWDYIISDVSEMSFQMDTTQLADGPNYILKITADDGVEKVSRIFESFTVKNNLPHISLDIPPNYFTKSNTPVITGKITGSEQNIVLTEYSLDGGASWKNAIASDGEFNSLIEKIEISIQEPLEDGKYVILIRAMDVLKRSVKISRSFNVDTVSPFIESPFLDKIIDDGQDVNSGAEGIQINFQGRTEPNATIELVLADKIFKITTGERGEFEVKDITLPVHGPNEISLKSTDLAENITEITGAVVLDNPPQISAVSIKGGEFLGGVQEFSWEVQDIDTDPIIARALYREGDGDWIVLAEELTSPSVLDISKIANGNYQIKIAVSDGMSETEAVLNIFIDNIAPKVILDNPAAQFTKNTRPSFQGQASDEFSGIQYAEYSFDNINWYKALITEGYESLKANFEFSHRFPLEDGNYQVRVRVSDRAGNITYPEPIDLTIDTTPPRIGSNLISSGSLVLFPDETGAIKLFKDTPYKILVSVDGEAQEVILKSDETVFNLNFNKATRLWESEFNFKDFGDHSLVINAKDGAGNFQDKEIAILNVIPLGTISSKETGMMIKEAKAALYFHDQNTNSWLIWDAEAFGQRNPQTTDESGEYGFLVPPGTYRLEVSHRDFKTIKSENLEIKKNYLINAEIPLINKGAIDKILDYFSWLIKL
ncbi:MAG: Ig-like domain-containing protein, partial [Candidatus Parcubacteria bacterium]|nr:Ig-like domain-containing protein [Candidatus Parcubacteria bacterium]